MNLCKRFLTKIPCLFMAAVVFGNCAASSVPEVKVTSDSEELMSSLFSGKVTANDVKVTGNPQQIGVFAGSENLLGLENGIVLSTGFVSETFKVQGKPSPWGSWSARPYDEKSETKIRPQEEPEDLPDITGVPDDYQFDEHGPAETQKTEDKDVENAAGNNHSYDSVSLEFDLIPSSEKIKLQYVYASSEWQRVFPAPPPEVVRGDAAQVKAAAEGDPRLLDYAAPDDTAILLINGENVAKIPSTGATLSAKNILEASGFDTSKPAPDPDVEFGSQGLFIDSTRNHDFGFLGRTKVIETIANVIPNEANHIKIAVSDIEDPFYNTALFLKITEADPENSNEQEIVNPKTGDINLGFIVASTLASATGLSVLLKRMRKNNPN